MNQVGLKSLLDILHKGSEGRKGLETHIQMHSSLRTPFVGGSCAHGERMTDAVASNIECALR